MKAVEISEAIAILNAEANKQQRLWELDPGIEWGNTVKIEHALYRFLADKTCDAAPDQFFAIHDQLLSRFTRRDLILVVIDRFLNVDDVEKAEELTQRLDPTLVYQGYRKILQYYAAKGDLAGYEKTLKKCDRRQEKSELAFFKGDFLQAYSRNNGFEAVLKIIEPEEYLWIAKSLRARIGLSSAKEIITLANRFLRKSDCDELFYIDVVEPVIKHEIERKQNVSDFVAQYLEYVLQIDPKKKIGGTNFGIRQQGLWRMAHNLVGEGYTVLARTVVKTMNSSPTKSELMEELKLLEVDRAEN